MKLHVYQKANSPLNLKILFHNGNGVNLIENPLEVDDNSQHCLLNSLQKDYLQRPNYRQLLEHQFLLCHACQDTDVAAYFQQVLDLPEVPLSNKTSNKN